ncbi:MAG: triose-phosphate isomerase [Deltaproteobacteria bacterium]|nr:MAG: triose-phosphate isomerase [Deltaproteobacteria bacterium]
MTRRPLIAGNWKLHKPLGEAVSFTQELKSALSPEEVVVDVVVGPTYPVLHAVSQAAEGSVIQVAAQNVNPNESGAFTGEVSSAMLKEVGCSYVIIGHSERRQIFGETDAFIEEKLQAVLNAGLLPILCLGETLEEREAGQTTARVGDQLSAALANVSAEQAANVTVAYEPIWAIGTGRTASPEQAQEVHAHLRSQLAERFGDVANDMRILYGGSVKPTNIEELIQQPDIDGALIGGASLKVDSFTTIIQTAQRVFQQS